MCNGYAASPKGVGLLICTWVLVDLRSGKSVTSRRSFIDLLHRGYEAPRMTKK